MNTDKARPSGHQREDCPKAVRQSWFLLQPFSPPRPSCGDWGHCPENWMHTRSVREQLPSTGHQYNSPHSPAGSKLCSLPRLTPKKTLGSAAQPQADSRLVPHRSHSYHNEPLHNLPSTKEYPRHSIHGYPIAQMNCWMPLQPFRVTSSPLFHGIKHYNLHAALDHSCWEIWPWLTPVGAHFHIPATGSSNLILHLESIICFISITCLNHNFAVFGEGRRVRPNSYLSKNSFKFLFKHLRTRPTWIHPLPQKFHLVSCPA